MTAAAAAAPDAPDPFAAGDWMKARSMLTVVAALTLALCTFFGFTEALFVIASQLGLIAVLVRPDLLTRVELWLVLAIAGTLVLISDWSVFDNHKYLLVYWLWVMTIAAYAQRDGLAESVLTSHARFFLVFIFLMAAAQKILSPTYMSGEMFEIKLLLDRRFAAFAQLIGIDPDTLAKVRLEISALRSPLSVFPDNARIISSNDTIRSAAHWITWYDLLIQIAIGFFFIFRSRMLDRIGHLCLLFFIYTTYLPAPVFGFGWLLSILGFALARKTEKPWIVNLYLASFVAIVLYQLPWREWVVNHG
jgi:hypothetical protein